MNLEKKAIALDPLLQRARTISIALRGTMTARGHVIDQDASPVLIRGEQISWYVYEPNRRLKVPLTKKELESVFYSHIAKKGWKSAIEPSGSLALFIKADFHSEIRIVETPGRPLESRIESIVDKLEKIATEAAERRKKREEAAQRQLERQRRRDERRRLQIIEDRKWEEFTELSDDWHQARRLRSFIAHVTKLHDAEPDPSGRVADWIAWTRANVDALDPLADGIDGFLERLFPPKPSEYELNFGEPEDEED